MRTEVAGVCLTFYISSIIVGCYLFSSKDTDILKVA